MVSNMNRLWRLSAPAIVLLVSAAAAEPLATGTAVYEVSLDGGDAAIAGLSGRMTAALEHECGVWRSSTELTADLTGADGTSLDLLVNSHHVEDPDSLNFALETSIGGMAVDSAKGVASKDADGIEVALSEPKEQRYSVAGDILFPVALVEAAIAAAKAGETFRAYRTFDGTGHGQEAWSVSVLITPASDSDFDEEEREFAKSIGLDRLDRWRMTLSYFPPGSGEQTPVYSATMVVYENGFAQAAVYDLGTFAMRLRLVEFSPSPPKPCP
jgi:hypothetical protein